MRKFIEFWKKDYQQTSSKFFWRSVFCAWMGCLIIVTWISLKNPTAAIWQFWYTIVWLFLLETGDQRSYWMKLAFEYSHGWGEALDAHGKTLREQKALLQEFKEFVEKQSNKKLNEKE